MDRYQFSLALRILVVHLAGKGEFNLDDMIAVLKRHALRATEDEVEAMAVELLVEGVLQARRKGGTRIFHIPALDDAGGST